MSTPISDALSTLSDRGLRRLLGARTFLRGLEYFRRRVVEDVTIGEMSATGTVRAADADPYQVVVDLTPDGIQSRYTDQVDIDAGVLTILVWAWANLLYRWRQHRWRQLATRNFRY